MGLRPSHGAGTEWFLAPLWRFLLTQHGTVPVKYPVPNIRDFTNNVAGSHVFSTLDLVKGYYQVNVS